jgi:hypothetical protein
MKNKKAVETRTVSIFVVLALIVLAIVLFSGSNAFKNLIDKWNILKPGFDRPGENNPEPERFRYDIQTDIVEFYDGATWHTFTEIPLNEKTFSSSQVKSDFTDNFYYPSNLQKEFHLEKVRNTKIAILDNWKPLGKIYEEEFSIEKIEKISGDITISVSYQGDISRPRLGIIKGEFILKENGEFLEKVDIISTWTGQLDSDYKQYQYIDEPELEIINKITAWRNSLLSTPITLNYKEGTNSKTAQSCVEKFDNRYLVADLIRQKPTGATC